MKVKVGRYSDFNIKYVEAIVDLDSQDILDLNFKNASSDNIYFFNIVNKLSFIGEMKIMNAWPEFDKNNPKHFVFIISDDEFTKKQMKYNNHKEFAKLVNDIKDSELIDNTKKIFNNVQTEFINKVNDIKNNEIVNNNINKLKKFAAKNLKSLANKLED